MKPVLDPIKLNIATARLKIFNTMEDSEATWELVCTSEYFILVQLIVMIISPD
jgi:hypothetical protein